MSFLDPSEIHHRTATNKKDVTSFGASLFGVSKEKFSDWRWQMKRQIQDANEIPNFSTNNTNEYQAFIKLKDKFHAGLTPYSISLIDFEDSLDPVRLQLMPRLEELQDKHGLSDPLNEVQNSPIKEMVHVYKDKVAWCVAQLCPVYCRYCFRKRRDEEVGLHFNQKIIDSGIKYISENKDIRDVLITGGDPFIASDNAIEKLLQRLREIPHVQIIRFGTRTPVALPYRITEELASMLAKYHPIWVNTHFNCANELTPESARAIDTLLRAGIPVGNQSVFLKNVNDTFEKTIALLNGLIQIRVRPYYIYHPQIVEGTEHLRIPIEQGLEIMRKLRGNTSGFAIPQYVLDTPSGKIPISPNHIIERKGDHVLLTQLNGKPWTEPNPLNGFIPEVSL